MKPTKCPAREKKLRQEKQKKGGYGENQKTRKQRPENCLTSFKTCFSANGLTNNT